MDVRDFKLKILETIIFVHFRDTNQPGRCQDSMWIGLVYNTTLNQFRWLDGTSLSFVMWGTDQPAPLPATNGNYVAMLKPGTFWYWSYAIPTYIICQYRLCMFFSKTSHTIIFD